MRWTRFWQSWLQENIFQSFDRSYRSRVGRNCLRQRALYITTLSSCEARLEAGSQSCQTQMNLLQLWTRWGNNINSNALFSISTIGLIDVQTILYDNREVDAWVWVWATSSGIFLKLLEPNLAEQEKFESSNRKLKRAPLSKTTQHWRTGSSRKLKLSSGFSRNSATTQLRAAQVRFVPICQKVEH